MRIKAGISFLVLIFLLMFSCRTSKQTLSYSDLKYPKREFRGAWFSTAWQSRYKTMSSEEMKDYFRKSLDQLHSMGINAVIFQVRPQADAFYKSKYEPWSVHLSGTQGVAPDNNFDPLAFLIKECHDRGIELHAWLNPYRVTTSANDKLVDDHIYYQKPELFVTYGDKIYFDPGKKESRNFICKVVKDIVLNYNVDAIHMDDYFYPYPISGVDFPDNDSFEESRHLGGFDKNDKNDWRRANVNSLIKEIKETLMTTKPWVRFGISPFGIYRNKKSTPDGSGSNTNGLQNYDDLFADVKLWAKEGWIDYNMPQIYWEIGHKTADYSTLVEWWAVNNFDRPLYIGQDAVRTMNMEAAPGRSQLAQKMMEARKFKSIEGSCFWPAYTLLDNYKNIAVDLETDYFKYPALIPAYTHMYNKKPAKVGKLKEEYTSTKHLLTWKGNHIENDPKTAFYYVVYCFENHEKIDLDRAQNIVAITPNAYYELPYINGKTPHKYVVTAVDRFYNESKPQEKKIKL